jgi:transposase
MFIKKITKRNIDTGCMYLTYRLVRSYRLDGKSRHETIINMGTLSGLEQSKHKQLAHRIEELLKNQPSMFDSPIDNTVESYANYFYKEILKKQSVKDTIESKSIDNSDIAATSEKVTPDYQEVDVNSFDIKECNEIGGEWLCWQAFDEIGLSDLLVNRLNFSTKEYQQAVNCLIGRMLYPGSDMRTASFLNENSGVHELFAESERATFINRKSLVKISEKLYSNKEQIIKVLNSNIENLLQFEPKLILYDLTNTHFEGQMSKSQKAQYGRNKQKRNDCPQITLALAVNEFGFPLYSAIYEGNISEIKTLKDLIKDISIKSKWIGSTKPIIVIDAGISSDENLIEIYLEGYDYVAISKSEHQKYRKLVVPEQLQEIESNSGVKLQVQAFNHEIRYKIDEDGKIIIKKGKKRDEEEHIIQEQLLYVKTDLKKKKEDSMLNGKRIKMEKELISLQASISKPKTDKKIETINQRIGRLKERYKQVQACFNIEVICEDKIVKSIHWEYINNNKKQADSGTYFIRSTKKNENEQTLWNLYRTIGEAEDVFRTMKSDLLIRAIYHQIDKNIESHLFVCVMAVLIVNFIRYKLKKSKINYCWSEIVRIMSTQKCAIGTIKHKDGRTIFLKKCTRPAPKARQIYDAMEYKYVPFYVKKYFVNEY